MSNFELSDNTDGNGHSPDDFYRIGVLVIWNFLKMQQQDREIFDQNFITPFKQ